MPPQRRLLRKEVRQVDSAACPVCGLRLDRAEMIATDRQFESNLGEKDATDYDVAVWKKTRRGRGCA